MLNYCSYVYNFNNMYFNITLNIILIHFKKLKINPIERKFAIT